MIASKTAIEIHVGITVSIILTSSKDLSNSKSAETMEVCPTF